MDHMVTELKIRINAQTNIALFLFQAISSHKIKQLQIIIMIIHYGQSAFALFSICCIYYTSQSCLCWIKYFLCLMYNNNNIW